jgi:hypothetical protein
MAAPSGTEPSPTPSTSAPRRSGRGVLWGLLAVVIAFLIGFGWQWYEAGTVRRQLAETQDQLMIERLRVRLGQATLAAQAGDYETARQQMSDFFTRLDDAQGSLPDSVAAVSGDFLAMRDNVITGLSRSNPEYAGVLYGMLESFSRGAPPTIPEAQPAGPATQPAGPAEQPAGPELPAPAATDTGPAPDSGMGG